MKYFFLSFIANAFIFLSIDWININPISFVYLRKDADKKYCALFKKEELNINHKINIYPIDCRDFKYSNKFDYITCLTIMLITFIVTIKAERKYYSTKKIYYLKVLILALLFQSITPLLFASIQQRLDESFITIYQKDYYWIYGRSDNEIKIIYDKPFGRYSAYDWLKATNFTFTFIYHFFIILITKNKFGLDIPKKLLEILIVITFFLIIMFGIYDHFIIIPKKIENVFLLNITLNFLFLFKTIKNNYDKKIWQFLINITINSGYLLLTIYMYDVGLDNIGTFLIIFYQFLLISFFVIKCKRYHIIYGEKTLQCSICLENTKENIIFIPCGHYICSQCNERNFKSCAMCREPVNKSIKYFSQSCPLHKYEYLMYNSHIEDVICSRCNVSTGNYYTLYGLE